MKYNSVRDIIGPIMVGPSSSHTAGAVRIGQIARSIYGGTPERADIIFYGSFAKTYRGHGTDVAIAAGLLGFSTFDDRIPDALELAEPEGMTVKLHVSHDRTDHPNTARIKLQGHLGTLDMVGVSVGGGAVSITEINGFRVRLQGDIPTLLIMHQDRSGMIAAVTNILAKYNINISHMEVSRTDKGKNALMSIETDEKISHELRVELRSLPDTQRVIQVQV